MNFLWKVTKAGVKVGVVFAAVKLSLDYDVWSLNTGKGADNYFRLQTSIFPGLEIFSKLPSSSEVRQSAQAKWNNGVKAVFRTIGTLCPFEESVPYKELSSSGTENKVDNLSS